MTDMNPAQFIKHLDAAVQNSQKERVRVLNVFTTLGRQYVKVREERDGAIAQIRELTMKLHAAAEELRRQKEVNNSLESDIRTMMSAVDTATREFVQSDAQMIERVAAIGADLNLSGLVAGDRRAAEKVARNQEHASIQQRNPVPASSASIVDFPIGTPADLKGQLEDLERLLTRRTTA